MKYVTNNSMQTHATIQYSTILLLNCLPWDTVCVYELLESIRVFIGGKVSRGGRP